MTARVAADSITAEVAQSFMPVSVKEVTQSATEESLQ